MRAYIVRLENRAGALADLCEALGAQSINIDGVAAATWGDRGAVAISTDEPDATRLLLDDQAAEYQEVDIVEASLEDRPGALGAAARRLADRGINIHAVIPLGNQGSRQQVGFVVDIAVAARDALGDLAAATSAAR